MALVELATEIKIPISESFTSLRLDPSFFKDKPGRAARAGEWRAQAASFRQLKAVQESTPIPIYPTHGAAIDGGLWPSTRQMNLQWLDAMIGSADREAERLLEPLHPQLFLVETYSLTTIRTATGKGDVVYTKTFAPGQEEVVEICTFSRKLSNSTDVHTVLESLDTTVAKSFNDQIAQSSTEQSSAESYDYRMQAHFHAEASLIGGGGSATADLNATGGSNSARTEVGKAVAQSVENQVARTAASRVQSTDESTVTTGGEESIKRTTLERIKNPNLSRTLNLFWYQLVQEYTSFLCLRNVQIAYRTTDPVLDRQVPLHELRGLLAEVGAAESVEKVHEYIFKELTEVLDYERNVRSLVEKFNLSGELLFRLKPELKTIYQATDSNGTALRPVSLDGLLIQVTKQNIPSRSNLVMDLVLGAESA